MTRPSAQSEPRSSRISFGEFYSHHFLAEHRQPGNIALHLVGTALGLALIPLSLTIWSPFALLAFPIVHVVPGLIGHRLFEPNPEVGNLRVDRKDFPLWWFLGANHLMAIDWLRRGAYWRRS